MNNMKSESHLEHNFGAVLEFILQNEGYEACNVSDKIIDDYIEFESTMGDTCRNGKEWDKCNCC